MDEYSLSRLTADELKYYDGLNSDTQERFDDLYRELKDMCRRKGFLGVAGLSFAWTSFMEWDNTAPEDKVSQLKSLIDEFLPDEQEKRFLLVSLNLIDEYKQTYGAENRRRELQECCYPDMPNASTASLTRNNDKAIFKLLQGILEAQGSGRLKAILNNRATPPELSSLSETADPVIEIGSSIWDWQFIRYLPLKKARADDSFFISSSRRIMLIHNEYQGVACAKTTLTLEPNSKYVFSVDIRMTGFEHSKDGEAPSQHSCGAYPLFDSYRDEYGKILKMGPPKISADDWTEVFWHVYTTDVCTYELELYNGSIGNTCKGTAWFRDLMYERI